MVKDKLLYKNALYRLKFPLERQKDMHVCVCVCEMGDLNDLKKQLIYTVNRAQ